MVNKQVDRKAVFLIVVVFVLGLALGAMASYLVSARSFASRSSYYWHRDRGEFVSELTRELNLSADQQKQLAQIIDETRARFHALSEQERPQVEKLRQQSREKIRAILTTQQTPKFDEFLRQLDAERKAHERH